MRNLLALVAVVGMVSVSACKKDEKKPEAAPATQPETKPDETKPEAKPPVAKEDKAPEMTNKMAHCPSSVEGAATAVSASEGAVVVTVTAKDEAAQTEIRKRATHLASLNDADSSEVKHSGNGTGGGALGKCPVALGLGKVAAEDAEGGSKITMTPKTPDGLAELNATVRDRATAMAARAGHEHGSGGGAGMHKGDGTGGGGGKGDGNGAGAGAGEGTPDAKDPKAAKEPATKTAPPAKKPLPTKKAPPAKKRGIDAGP